MHMPFPRALSAGAIALTMLGGSALSAENEPVPKARDTAPLVPLSAHWELTDTKLHRDFPAMVIDGAGTAWVVFIEHDGKRDTLKLARKKDGFEIIATISEPGIIHQPAVACGRNGAIWTFWGQVDERNIVTLRGRCFAGGRFEAPLVLARSEASDSFADARTDHAGRVWVAWQSLRRGQADIFARWREPKTGEWSREIAVSKPEGGNWEPRLGFDDRNGAWIVFDSSRGGEFNLYLAHVELTGRVKEQQLTSSPEYEARARIIGSKSGRTLWITAERGRQQWGMQMRGHSGDTGLNGEKRMLLGYYDIDSARFTEVPVPASGKLAPRIAAHINLPAIATDTAGNPWLAFRYFVQTRWLIGVTRYDTMEKTWSQPLELPDSSFGQDRHCILARKGDRMFLCWASDKRTNKLAQIAGVYLAELKPEFTPYENRSGRLTQGVDPKPYMNPVTPDRPRDQHHTWNIGGKKYRLVYGDLHRHTDFSNCRCGGDGCVTEHFRYAYDMAALDFMGTSDHTDVGKKYDPYEWWQTQRAVDVFYAPGKFASLYAYEREQPYPWGHRNVVFPERGGPIIYIKRQLYQASPWNAPYPVQAGGTDITPMELWGLLRQYGKPVALISHTGATAMGTDWDRYERIDGTLENTVEIFQGARVSYEGLGAPQPTAGLRAGESYTADAKSEAVIPEPPAGIADFGKERNNGVYQHALARGHKLGVFASSDHISAHTSFGGVYVEEFTREGIVAGLAARRSIAATDKIFVEFSCNGQPMGSIFETASKPELTLAVHGTGALKRVTLVRNEMNYQVWETDKRDFTQDFTEPAPLAGENRYYLRIEQADGNMAWSSPVWVTVKGGK